MIKKRQAITPILSTVVLISIGLVIVAGVSLFYLGISYDSLNCEIQSAKIFEISDSVFWGMVQMYNNGEYSIQEYSIIIHDDTQKITVGTFTDVDISPKTIIVEEFEVTQTISSENVLVGVSISFEESSSQCVMGVKIESNS